MKRRELLHHTAATTGLFTMPTFPNYLFAADRRKYANDQVKFGNTGVSVSRLAMGTGTHGVGKRSNQTRKLGVQGLADLLYAGYDQGITFWDSADQYGTHPHLKAALEYVPREKVVIMSKTHATTEKEMKEDLDRFRKELGTDYIDVILLHLMTDPNWPSIKKGAMNVLSQAKEDGIVKTVGVSCHSLGALKAAEQSDWVEVDLARINPYGTRMDAGVREVETVLRSMKKKGKSIIGMKVFGAGRHVTQIDDCLQYALAQDFIDCFTIGQENQNEMNDLVKRIPEASVRG